MHIRLSKDRLTLSLVGVNVAKLTEFITKDADGWTIFEVAPFREMGLTEESLAAISQLHQSDTSNVKATIFDDNGKVIDKLYGVYGLDFVQKVCGLLTGDGNSRFSGRGFRCTDCKKRLLPVLEQFKADGVEVLTADHIKQ